MLRVISVRVGNGRDLYLAVAMSAVGERQPKMPATRIWFSGSLLKGAISAGKVLDVLSGEASGRHRRCRCQWHSPSVVLGQVSVLAWQSVKAVSKEWSAG